MTPTLEERMYERVAVLRTKAVLPFVKLLAGLGVTPDILSYCGAALMLGFMFTVPRHPGPAIALVILAVLLDGIDGSLARYLKTASDKGKFTDMVMDNLGFTFFVFGLLMAGTLTGFIAAALAYCMLLCKVLMVVRKNLGKTSDWLIHAMAGFFPNLFVFGLYALFIAHSHIGGAWLNAVCGASAALLACASAREYLLIRATVFKP